MSSYDEFRIPANMELRKALFKFAVEGKWGDVVKYCGQHPWLFGERITKLGNTALHLAVSESKESVVKQLVGIIKSRFDVYDSVRVLSTRNKEGNTPLHLAVSVGKVGMCRCICDERPQLIGAQNEEGETPLFLAARVGQMDAFTYLVSSDTQYFYVKIRNYKGDTVLHSAIGGENWKLAFFVLQHFEQLSHATNEEGATPLHLLAEKPGAFRSGTHLSLFDELIYHCKNLMIPSAAVYYKDKTSSRTTESMGKHIPQHSDSDASGALPHYMIDIVEQGYVEDETRKEESNTGRFSIPPNYDTCFNFITLGKMEIWILVLHILKLSIAWLKRQTSMKGQNYIQTIKKKKETNLFCAEIMHRLLGLQNLQPYDLQIAGSNPIFNSAEETEEKAAFYSSLPDFNIARPETEGDYNWGVLFKLEKDVARPDAVLLSGVGRGTAACVVANAREIAIDLDDEHHRGAQIKDVRNGQTPILLAAKNGIVEMVEEILVMNPIAIHDVDMNKKNAVLLAIENRHPTVCEFLKKKYGQENSLFGAVDREGCSALHLAAKLSDNRPSFIIGSVLEMQQEVQWFEYVKASMPRHLLSTRNYRNETANEIFMKDHKELMEKGKQWAKETASACSVVGTFIATMAYTALTTAPGGSKEGSGNKPSTREQEAAIKMFAISSFTTFAFSVTSVVMFLATFISRNPVMGFAKDLSVKILLGLTCLFISIVSMFCASYAGTFYVRKNQVRNSELATLAITFLPAAYFLEFQFGAYVALIWASFRAVPLRWVEEARW